MFVKVRLPLCDKTFPIFRQRRIQPKFLTPKTLTISNSKINSFLLLEGSWVIFFIYRMSAKNNNKNHNSQRNKQPSRKIFRENFLPKISNLKSLTVLRVENSISENPTSFLKKKGAFYRRRETRVSILGPAARFSAHFGILKFKISNPIQNNSNGK